MRFTLTIQCDNAAFGDSGEERAAEIALILRDAAKHVERDGSYYRRLHDSNGNRVGQYALDERDGMEIDPAA